MFEVIDSIPWVRCASGFFYQLFFQLFSTFFNVFFIFFYLFLTFLQLFFPTFFRLVFPTFFSTFSQLWCQLFLNFCLQLFSSTCFFFTCTSSNCGSQVASLVLVSILATRWRHLHCHIAWDCPLTSSVGIELLSSSARVTSVKSAKPFVLTDWVSYIRTHRSDPRDTWVR